MGVKVRKKAWGCGILYLLTLTIGATSIGLVPLANGATTSEMLANQLKPSATLDGNVTGRVSAAFKFTPDYVAGTRDIAGNFMGGTEIMNLVAHRGRLYAGIGYWMDIPYGENKAAYPWTGAQILVKDSAGSAWRLEYNLGLETLRVDAMKSAVFTTDSRGEKLSDPVYMLVASSIDSVNKGLWVWARNEITGAWTKMNLEKLERTDYCRSFGMYTDRITGVDCIFAGSASGKIFRGVYDPTPPGRIRWAGTPELSAGNGRVMGFTVANGVLYASVADILYKRKDGMTSSWSAVYHWETPVDPTGGYVNKEMRGLTTIPNPNL